MVYPNIQTGLSFPTITTTLTTYSKLSLISINDVEDLDLHYKKTLSIIVTLMLSHFTIAKTSTSSSIYTLMIINKPYTLYVTPPLLLTMLS